MAKIIDNLVTEGLSGKLGKRLVFRKGKGGNTILSTRPVFSADRQFNVSQLAQQEAFKQAIVYAKVAKNQPLYITLAKGTAKTAYNIAVEDWFGEPQVLSIDITGWTGQIGQEIRVRAQDNIKVSSVHVVIRADNNTTTPLEEGDAVPSEVDGLLWIYTTKTVIAQTPATHLDAYAYDLAGNFGASALELN